MKKGFTLIELLTVIVLLGIIAAIAYPTVRTITKKNIEKAYQEQIQRLENTGNLWVSSHADKVGYTETYYLTFEQLHKDEFISSSDVMNPKTEKPLTGCLKIEWDNVYHQHIVTYVESCPA